MPRWTLELIESPWERDNPVRLRDPELYDSAARNGGSDKIQRQKPLSYVAGTGRAAGTSGVIEEPDAREHRYDPTDPKGWEEALTDGSRVVNVRDVKCAVPKYVHVAEYEAFEILIRLQL